MKFNRFVVAVTLATAMSLLGLAWAACFPSITLGEFNLGEWSNADRTWVISDKVGDFNDRASSRSELRQHRNRLVRSCETKGQNLITQAETHFNGVKDGLSDSFNASCDAGALCGEFRVLWVQAETASIDDHVATMRTWYQDNIKKCKGHFRGTFNVLKKQVCY